jgi:hypothetical protein
VRVWRGRRGSIAYILIYVAPLLDQDNTTLSLVVHTEGSTAKANLLDLRHRSFGFCLQPKLFMTNEALLSAQDTLREGG